MAVYKTGKRLGSTGKTWRLRGKLRSTAVLGALLGALACQCTEIGRGTRLQISLDAPDDLRSRIARVEIALYTQLEHAWQLRAQERLKPDGADGWPVLWSYARTSSQDKRYSLEAQAFDAMGASIAQLKATGVFQDQQTVELSTRFDASCAEACPNQQSCSDGVCIDAEELASKATVGSPAQTDTDAETEDAERGADSAARASGAAGRTQANHCDAGSDSCGADHDDCGADHGGCDALVSCQLQQGEPRCGSCPDGFTRAGDRGCRTLLSGVEVEGATLDPSFSPEHTEYVLTTGLLKNQWQLTPSAQDGATLIVEDAPLERGAAVLPERFGPAASSFSVEAQARGHAGLRYRFQLSAVGHQRELLKADAPKQDAQLGYRMAVDGDTLVVGATGDANSAQGVNPPRGVDNSAKDSGAVYVFRRRASRWEQEAYIKASDASPGDEFGVGVAVQGDSLVVGSWNAHKQGVVYAYERSGETWREQAILTPADPQAEANFGQGVSMHGNTLVVGAGSYDQGANDSGAVFVYSRAGAGQPWEFVRTVGPEAPTSYAWFGSSVKLSERYLVVGATGEGNGTVASGAAYVFRADTFEPVDVLRPSAAAAAGFFGEYMAVAGETVVVSSFNNNAGLASGTVYVYERAADGKFEQKSALQASNAKGGDQFGSSVALTGDYLLVGAAHESSGAKGIDGTLSDPSVNNGGAAYLFVRTNQGFSQAAHIKADEPQAGAQLGSTVAISGAELLIGAMGDAHAAMDSGAVYVFR